MAPATEVGGSNSIQKESVPTPIDRNKRYQENEKIINEEFKIWKKTVPLLYDTIYTRAFEWPNLTIQWHPTYYKLNESKTMVSLKFLVGTNTSSNSKDYLKIYSIDLPASLSNDYKTALPISTTSSSRIEQSLKLLHQWEHPGEVNKARFNCLGNKIATLTNSGSILIFNVDKNEASYEYELKFHTKDGFGLEWNPNNPNQLISGTQDTKLAFWDLTFSVSKPKKIIETHDSVINDISWNKKYNYLIASVSDDKTLQIHDLRIENGVDVKNPLLKIEQAHGPNFDINAVSFNPELGNLLVTGGSDNLINCWDLRKMSKPFRKLYGHNASILQLQFNPLKPNQLMSSSIDRRLMIWDLSKLNDEDFDEQEFVKNIDYNDPIAKFIHGGFTSGISDFQWSPILEDLVIASGDDNLIEIFKPHIVEEAEEEEEEEGEDEGDGDEKMEEEEEQEHQEVKREVEQEKNEKSKEDENDHKEEKKEQEEGDVEMKE